MALRLAVLRFHRLENRRFIGRDALTRMGVRSLADVRRIAGSFNPFIIGRCIDVFKTNNKLVV